MGTEGSGHAFGAGEAVIAEAVGTATTSERGKAIAIQDAMAAAVLECSAEGITDPDIVRARILEAREEIMAES